MNLPITTSTNIEHTQIRTITQNREEKEKQTHDLRGSAEKPTSTGKTREKNSTMMKREIQSLKNSPNPSRTLISQTSHKTA